MKNLQTEKIKSIKKTNRQANYDLIDFFKLLCALLVVSIHVPFLSEVSEPLDFALNQYIARIAVPFFFTAGGYFCFKKTDENNFDMKIIINYALRMISLYLIWVAISSIPLLVLNKFSFSTFLKDAFIGYGAFWYLKSSAVSVLLIGILLSKKINIKKIVIIALFLYLIGLVHLPYHRLLFKTIETLPSWYTRNGIFFGLFFTSAGAFFAYKNIKISKKLSFLLLVISMALWAMEVYFLYTRKISTSGTKCIFLAPSVFLIFYLVLNSQIKFPFNTKILRELSTYVYFLHGIACNFFLPICEKIISLIFGIKFTHTSLLVAYPATVLISVAIALTIMKLKKTKYFSWLKILS